MDSIENEVKLVSASFLQTSLLSSQQKNDLLERLIELLRESKDEILNANQKDCALNKDKISPSLFQRLQLGETKFDGLLTGISDLIKLPDPVGKIIEEKELQPGLILQKTSVPLGVLAIIFEARPDAMVQILSLILKSGNTALLKGGSEAFHTNRATANVFHRLAEQSKVLPEKWFSLLQGREQVHEVLKYDQYIDLVIPRGSNELVQKVMNSTKIPVLGHADGICHIYVDDPCDDEMALEIIINSKIQYPSACNAVETVLIHKSQADTFVPKLLERCQKSGVEVFGCDVIAKYDSKVLAPKSWSTEYGDLRMAVKVIDDVGAAIAHINQFGSGHTDCIVTQSSDRQVAFQQGVDSASVFVNCSTRFADGFRFGMGAEIGISTSKTHARGPVGLEGLMSSKFLVTGNGHQVR